MANINETLAKAVELSWKIDSLLRLLTYNKCDDLSGLEINYEDAEQVFLLDELRVVMDKLADAQDKIPYLNRPIKETSRLYKNENGKFETKGGHWLGYYYIADIKRILQGRNEWLRRRFRMYIWKQWKKPRTKVQNLQKLGMPKDKAYQWGNSRLGYRRVAGSPILQRAITNEKLALAGYFDFPAQYEQLRKLHSCG